MTFTVAIIGGGFSGTMTAAQLLRAEPLGVRGVTTALHVVLIDRVDPPGRGIAYGTRDVQHLLNVPAARMSAWPDQPDSLVAWARERDPRVTGADFLPRWTYGSYVYDQLDAAARSNPARTTIELRVAEVLAVVPYATGGFAVATNNGVIAADAVVLATGHRPPNDPLAACWRGPRDRWFSSARQAVRRYGIHGIGAEQPVVLLGSGLSAIDALLTLNVMPRSAPVIAISRHGLLPRAHLPASRVPPPRIDLGPAIDAVLADGASVDALVRMVRRAVASAADWRHVVDALRPHTARIWGALSVDEAAAFVRHVRPLWEVHRHRMAPSVAAIVDAELRSGQFAVRAGRVVSARGSEDGVKLEVQLRDGRKRSERIDAAWVINCTGPGSLRAPLPPPLESLLVAGALEQDALGLGVLTNDDHQAVAGGVARPDLYVIGTLCKPRLWESTAVPELREQAATIARSLLAQLS